MESIHMPHLPQHPLHVVLFKDVRNAAMLRTQLLEGNTDFQYAFLDAAVLISRTHVLAACFRAINELLNDRLRTHNVHSEIVFALSPNNNIAEAFRRFGLSEDSRNIVAIKVAGEASHIEKHLLSSVLGQPTAFTDETLSSMRDAARIRKIYRLPAPKKNEPATSLDPDAEVFVLASMALRGT